MNQGIWYKIVEAKIQPGYHYKTLFHGVNRSRILPLDRWLEADIKMVSDGSNGTQYLSGWHIASRPTCFEYLLKFTANRKLAIVMCEVRGKIWSKKHSPSKIFLCKWINIRGAVT